MLADVVVAPGGKVVERDDRVPAGEESVPEV
jgi:hypothetical protein